MPAKKAKSDAPPRKKKKLSHEAAAGGKNLMTGSCECSKCGRKSATGVSWQYTEEDEHGNDIPIHDKCKDCFAVYLKGFAQYVDWEDWCAESRTAVGQTQEEEVRATMRGDAKSLDFKKVEVEEFKEVDLTVQRSLVILNSDEYRSEMGSKPLARHPKTFEMTIPTMNGEEKVFGFVDEDNPFRKLILSAKVGRGLAKTLLHREENMHSGHGDEYFSRNVCEEFCSTSDICKAFLGTMHIASIDRFKQKVQDPSGKGGKADDDVEPGSNNPGEDNTTPRGRRAASCKRGEAGADAKSRPGLASASGKATVVSQPGSPRPALSEISASPSAVGSALTEMPRFMRGKSSVWGDTESASPSAVPYDSQRDSDLGIQPGDSEALRWIKRTPLHAILAGMKKGVQVRHATLAVAKIRKHDDDDATLLQRHLKKAEAAERLADKKSFFSRAITEHLADLRELGDEPLPVDLKANLVQLFVTKHMQIVVGTGGREGMDELFDTLSPLRRKGQAVDFRCEKPMVSHFESEAGFRVQTFVGKVLSTCVIPLAKGGQEKQSLLKLVLDKCFAVMDGDDVEDMDDQAGTAMSNLASICRALMVILNPTWHLMLEASQDLEFMANLLKENGTSKFHVLATTVKAQPDWSKGYDACMVLLRDLKEHGDDMTDAQECLDVIKQHGDDLAPQISGILPVIDKVHMWAAIFPPGFVQSLVGACEAECARILEVAKGGSLASGASWPMELAKDVDTLVVKAKTVYKESTSIQQSVKHFESAAKSKQADSTRATLEMHCKKIIEVGTDLEAATTYLNDQGIIAAAQAARGLSVNQATADILENMSVHLFGLMVGRLKDGCLNLIVELVCVAAQVFGDRSDMKAKIDMVCHVIPLAVAHADFREIEDLEAARGHSHELKALHARALASAQLVPNWECELHAEMLEFIAKSGEVLAAWSSESVGKKQAPLDAAIDNVNQLLLPEGAGLLHWKDDLLKAKVITWSMATRTMKEKLLKDNPEPLQKAVDELKEAAPPRTCTPHGEAMCDECGLAPCPKQSSCVEHGCLNISCERST